MLWCGCAVEAPTNMGRKSQAHDPSRFLRASGVSYGCGLRGAWWRGGEGSRRRDGGGGGMWSLSLTGLQTGQCLLDEFGACGRHGSVRRWGRLLGWSWLCVRGGLLGLGLWLGGRRGKSLTPEGVSYRCGLRRVCWRGAGGVVVGGVRVGGGWVGGGVVVPCVWWWTLGVWFR